MAETARKMKANKRIQGVGCGWCLNSLQLGEDAAVCTECEKVHHADCWDDKNGCANPSCVNAPVKRLDEPVEEAPLLDDVPQGYRKCPGCGHLVPQGAQICNLCDQVLAADGIYRGPKAEAPGSVAALVCGIISVLPICVGVILGAIAITQAQKAKANIALNPRYGGEGMATAGFVLGIIGIVLNLILIVLNFAFRAVM